MLEVTKISHPGPAWERPSCEGEINRYGRKYECDFGARYKVNGKKLCDRHAGRLVLKELCKE